MRLLRQNVDATLPSIPAGAAILDPVVAAQNQTGLLSCAWFGGDVAGAESSSVVISVLPNAKTDYADYASNPATPADATDTLGDRSVLDCALDHRNQRCNAAMLVGSFWANVAIETNVEDMTQTGALGMTATVGAAVAHSVRQAGPPAPGWKPPATKWAEVATCADLDRGRAVPSTLASPSLTVLTTDNVGGLDPTYYLAEARSRVLRCTWSTRYPAPAGETGGLSAAIVPGGEWAWPLLSSMSGISGEATLVPGADAAAYRCDAQSCWLDVLGSHSWLRLQMLYSTETNARVHLIAAATALIAP